MSSTSEETNKSIPFETWTFDKPCENMTRTELPVPQLSVVVCDDIEEVLSSDLVIVGVFGSLGNEKDCSPAPKIDKLLGGALTDLMAENMKEFKNGAVAGTMSPTLRMVTKGSDGVNKSTRYVLLGLGTEDKVMEDGMAKKVGAEIASKCVAEKKITSCSVLLPTPASLEDASSSLYLFNLSSSFYSTLYSDNRYRTGDKKTTPAEDLTGGVKLVLPTASSEAESAVARGRGMAKGLFLTKDIVNAPHNVLNSHSLASVARAISEESDGALTCTILGKEECEKRGMGAYLGVARGSETEPQFIHLTYKGKGEIKKKVGIIGKGLLFDTGGYNIKTAMMELMKFDCGGAAAVLGGALAVAALAPEGVEAHFIVAACENMVNDRAIVPSDILTASNGKTIEVLNTDAEGRLTLADALVYADKEVGCDSIIELSTLTGACMVSLGKGMCGLWTDDDDLASELAEVSKDTGDRSWRMPLDKDQNKLLESKIADISNLGTRYGGAIQAALFLNNFVENKPFAHLDIAGPVWDDKTGATGFGAKLVAEWVKKSGQ